MAGVKDNRNKTTLSEGEVSSFFIGVGAYWFAVTKQEIWNMYISVIPVRPIFL